MMSRPAFVAPFCRVEEPTLAEVPACGWRSVTAVTRGGREMVDVGADLEPAEVDPGMGARERHGEDAR